MRKRYVPPFRQPDSDRGRSAQPWRPIRVPGDAGHIDARRYRNPDAGRSNPTTFRPDALYEFVIASDGGAREDPALRMSFGEPDADGNQEMRVGCAVGPPSPSGLEGSELESAIPGKPSPERWRSSVVRPGARPVLGRRRRAVRVQSRPGRQPVPSRAVHRDAAQPAGWPERHRHRPSDPGRHVRRHRRRLWARIACSGTPPSDRSAGRPSIAPVIFLPQPGADTEALNAGLRPRRRHVHRRRAATAAHVAERVEPPTPTNMLRPLSPHSCPTSCGTGPASRRASRPARETAAASTTTHSEPRCR